MEKVGGRGGERLGREEPVMAGEETIGEEESAWMTEVQIHQGTPKKKEEKKKKSDGLIMSRNKKTLN